MRVDLSLLPNTGGTTPDPTRPKPLISRGYGSLLVTFFKRFGRLGSLLVPPMAPGRYHGGGGRLLVATGGTQSDPMAPESLISRGSGSLLVAFLKRFGRLGSLLVATGGTLFWSIPLIQMLQKDGVFC